MKRTLITLAALLACVHGLHASVVYSDQFNYPDGGIVANSSWVNNTGTAGSMLVSNNQLVVSTSRTEDIAHTLTGAPFTTNSGSVLYSSFTVKFTQLPTVTVAYFAHFAGQNTYGAMTGHRARIWAAATNNAAVNTNASGYFSLYIVNAVGSTTNGNNQWPTPLTTNVTYTIVTRYNVGAASATLWVNPTSESDAGVTDPIYTPSDFDANGLPTNGPVNISYCNFRQATGEGTMWIDDLKVGTAFNDVAGANTPPTISPVPNQNTPAGTATAPIAFVVGDAETPAANLTVTASSSNPSLVPNANIVLGGAGANRTATITPASGQQGSVTITLSVKDTDNNTTSTTFVLTVGAPSISGIPDQNSPVGAAVPAVPFTISDNESPASSLTLSANSSNPSLIPNGSIVFGGSAGNRTISMTPVSGATGVATIKVSVSDGINTTSTQFVVTINPLFGLLFSDSFPNDGPIEGPGTAWTFTSGSPGQMQVVGGQAMVTYTNTEDVAVTLNNSPFYPSNGVILYCSFTLKCVDLPSSLGNYFLHFKDSSTTFKGKVFACATNAATGCFRLGVANAANAATAVVNRDLATNATYTVVLRYNVASAVSTLWVNPAGESDGSVTATDSTATSTVTGIALREDTYEGTLLVDDLKVGTAWTDVVTVAPTFKLSVIGGSSPQISWPTAAVGYILQSSTDLVNWQNVTQSPTVVGDQNVLPVTPSGKMQFFRLKQ